MHYFLINISVTAAVQSTVEFALRSTLQRAFMQFENSFDVPLPPSEAWRTLLDVHKVVPCLPGAELTEVVDDKTYKGKVSVRLGPISLVFSGTFVFEEINQENLSVRAAARGVDDKGRGGADARVRFAFEPSANGTQVVVDTTLNLSGSVAQYGRVSGVIRGVANQLTTEFANNLKSQINAERTASSSQPTDSPKAAKPISAFGLLVKVVRSWLAELFSSRKGIVRGKLTGPRRP